MEKLGILFKSMHNFILSQGDSGGPILSQRRLKNGRHTNVLVAIHKGTDDYDPPPRERKFWAINVHYYYDWIKYIMDYKQFLNETKPWFVCCDAEEYGKYRLTNPENREIADFDTY